MDILTDTPQSTAKRLARSISDASTIDAYLRTNFGRSIEPRTLARYIREAREPAHDYGPPIGGPDFQVRGILGARVAEKRIPKDYATPSDIIATVAHVYGFTAEEVRQRHGGWKYTPPRQIIAQLLYSRDKSTLPSIGAHMNRDHTSVISMLKGFNKARTCTRPESIELITTYHEFAEDWGIEDVVYPN